MLYILFTSNTSYYITLKYIYIHVFGIVTHIQSHTHNHHINCITVWGDYNIIIRSRGDNEIIITHHGIYTHIIIYT